MDQPTWLRFATSRCGGAQAQRGSVSLVERAVRRSTPLPLPSPAVRRRRLAGRRLRSLLPVRECVLPPRLRLRPRGPPRCAGCPRGVWRRSTCARGPGPPGVTRRGPGRASPAGVGHRAQRRATGAQTTTAPAPRAAPAEPEWVARRGPSPSREWSLRGALGDLLGPFPPPRRAYLPRPPTSDRWRPARVRRVERRRSRSRRRRASGACGPRSSAQPAPGGTGGCCTA